MDYLRLFPRRHLAEKPVMASPNVDCFLRLVERSFYNYALHDPSINHEFATYLTRYSR